ncbi:hypothetical protein DQ04_01781150 [Trypanosoma grayi]|uniref:hypothetical protein n=1 Tax=Trypanosoma grayi TaxID=71804 RepID=UPI0004F41C88|nr:hypothetical protein DQ04_01781150 [Trypanosoma grayi]KEG12351.1 hypothetical protein DQ04_01781150 [Trypanosoma grayi]
MLDGASPRCAMHGNSRPHYCNREHVGIPRVRQVQRILHDKRHCHMRVIDLWGCPQENNIGTPKSRCEHQQQMTMMQQRNEAWRLPSGRSVLQEKLCRRGG